jgi:hypothetical protein
MSPLQYLLIVLLAFFPIKGIDNDTKKFSSFTPLLFSIASSNLVTDD